MGRAITSATCCPSQCGGVAAPPTLFAQKEVLRYPSQRYHHPRPPVESRRECLGGMGREARGWAEVTREECGVAHCTAGGFGSERPVGRDRERERERERDGELRVTYGSPSDSRTAGRPSHRCASKCWARTSSEPVSETRSTEPIDELLSNEAIARRKKEPRDW